MHPFANTDELYGDPQFTLNGYRYPASRGSIELREHHARHANGFRKLLRLGNTVLTRRPVEDEEKGLVVAVAEASIVTSCWSRSVNCVGRSSGAGHSGLP